MQYYHFSQATILRIHGADAKRYLNARLSNDVTLCSNTQALQAAILTAQGKTEGYGTLFQDDDAYYFYCAEGSSEDITTALGRFIVADQVTVEQAHALSLIHCVFLEKSVEDVLSTSVLSTPYVVQRNHNQIFIPCKRINTPGYDILIKNEHREDFLKTLSNNGGTAIAPSDFHFLRITASEVTFPYELNDKLLFSEAQLDQAVSFSKGCYVGQETLEMVAARGKLPAVLRSFTARSCTQDFTGANAFLDPEEKEKVGSVVSYATNQKENACACFVRMKSAHKDLEHIFINGTRFDLSSTITSA